MKISSFGATDIGKKRAGNEDAFLLNDKLFLYAVADGVGGNEGGEIASRMAVDALTASMQDLLGEKERSPQTAARSGTDPDIMALRQAITIANQTIRREQSLNPAIASMATTLTVLLLGNGRLYLAHVGDSRAYLLRSGKFTQLTDDHSFVMEQLRAGVITVEQAQTSPYRHVITRALGIDDEVKADFSERSLQPDDRFLLCTDGLTGMVDDTEISRLLSTETPDNAVRKLLAAANDGGGLDNITVVVVRVIEV